MTTSSIFHHCPAPRDWTIEDFDYQLPEALIAQHPLPGRTDSRLLVPAHAGQPMLDARFRNIGQHLRAGDLLVMNNTRVIPARLLGLKRDSGGQVEVLIERLISSHEAVVMLRSSKSPRPGVALRFGEFEAEVIGRQDSFFILRFKQPVDEVLAHQGHVPLPPYITHADEPEDHERYQTVYASVPGAVAAPTAGLHFDVPLLDSLRAQGIDTAEVTLHVGAGTFQPVRVHRVAEHQMHREWYRVSEQVAQKIAATRERGGRIVAVGTTAMRTLESAAKLSGRVQAGESETQLFITPGFQFQVVDALITNFHLPKSTLMMLVSAFAGFDLIRAAYAHAIAQQYRFFSYGDAMLLHRAAPELHHA
jgi:S-adenosylmethionine:tRNA ribosyltransferase-isomerase